jgi:ATP-dependent DNA helicase PIF1
MSRAPSRTNIQILALPPDAESQEKEAKKKVEEKYYKGFQAKIIGMPQIKR